MALATSNKQASKPKKLTGDHQRRSKHFVKTYWPYIPVLSLSAILVIALGAWVIGPAGAVFGTITVGVAVVALLV
jgi:hypothetical protein